MDEKKIFHENSNQKRARVAVLIQGKQTWRQNLLLERKNIFYITKELMQKYIHTSINAHEPNYRAQNM